ncbi:MAG: hypothetical protein K6F88_00065 [Ruminococcus sp.]|nr:hypothetical protein [Ruminococcus sp.]
MENIQDKIAEIMADPEALKEVQNLGKMLGLGSDEPAPPPPPPESNGLMSGEALGAVTKLMPLLSMANREDDTTRLLAALRPFLSEEKCRKLDSAKKMLQIMKLLPALKEGGLLDFF